MHIHPEGFITQHIQIHILINSTSIPFPQIHHLQSHSLLIQLPHLGIGSIHNPVDTRRHNIIDRSFRGILFQIHHRHIESRILVIVRQTVVQRPFIFPPVIPHQIEARHTQHDTVLKSFQEHTHKTNRLQIRLPPLRALGAIQRNPDLIPFNFLRGSVRQFNRSRGYTADEILSHLHFIRSQMKVITEKSFRFIQRIIAVNILHIGQCGCSRGIGFRRHFRRRRIAFRAVIAFIPFQNRSLQSIEIRSPEKMVIIACRIVISILINL